MLKKTERDHIESMMEVYRQYLLSDSWKRRNDLKKQLTRLEKDWEEYKRFKKGGKYGTCQNENRRPCTV